MGVGGGGGVFFSFRFRGGVFFRSFFLTYLALAPWLSLSLSRQPKKNKTKDGRKVAGAPPAGAASRIIWRENVRVFYSFFFFFLFSPRPISCLPPLPSSFPSFSRSSLKVPFVSSPRPRLPTPSLTLTLTTGLPLQLRGGRGASQRLGLLGPGARAARAPRRGAEAARRLRDAVVREPRGARVDPGRVARARAIEAEAEKGVKGSRSGGFFLERKRKRKEKNGKTGLFFFLLFLVICFSSFRYKLSAPSLRAAPWRPASPRSARQRRAPRRRPRPASSRPPRR